MLLDVDRVCVSELPSITSFIEVFMLWSKFEYIQSLIFLIFSTISLSFGT